MSNADNYRKVVVDKLIPYAREDERIILLVSDMGFGAIDKFKEEFPHRIFNTGIMEQGSVGIAAGMALSGLIPVFYTIVNFLVYRAIEQVRNDVIKQGLNVKFISTGVNDYFDFMGYSHCCSQDDKKLMELVNLPVFDPYEKEGIDFDQMVKEWMTSPIAGYMRV